MDRNGWNLNRSQRMQMKAFICLLGILLLVILLFGKLLLLLIHKGDDEEIPVPTPEPHIPVIQLMANVWIMESDEEGLLIFRDGQSEFYPWGGQTAAGQPEIGTSGVSNRGAGRGSGEKRRGTDSGPYSQGTGGGYRADGRGRHGCDGSG